MGAEKVPHPSESSFINAKVVEIASRDVNFGGRGQCPKLTSMILAMLPSPRAVAEHAEDGRPHKLARLAYTAPVVDMLKDLKADELLGAKTEMKSDGFANSEDTVGGKDYADIVPWCAYDEMPDAAADTLADMLPPFTYRFKRPDGEPWRKDGPLTNDTREILQTDLYTGLYSMLRDDHGIPRKSVLEALSQCTFDFELRAKEGALLDVFWPNQLVRFPKTYFDPAQKYFELVGQGQRCRDYFKSVAFTGLTCVDATYVAKRLNETLTGKAIVVDLWQHDVKMRIHNSDDRALDFTTQDYKALVMLLEEHTSGDGGSTQHRPASDAHLALESLPGYFEIVPGRFTRLTYPERISRCSSCFNIGCHSWICEAEDDEEDDEVCSECGEIHEREDDDETDLDDEDTVFSEDGN